MNEQKIIKNKQLLKSYITLIFLIKLVFCSTITENLDVNFMKTFELKDGNILAFTEIGIYLYNNAEEEYILQKSLPNPDNKFNFVTINQFEVGEKLIVVLYENYIYVLTEEGYYFTEKNVNFGSTGSYYTLVPYKSEKNNEEYIDYYYFFVGYLNRNDGNNPFNIDYFHINYNSKAINMISRYYLSIPGYGVNDNIHTEKGFSCQIMNSVDYGEVLTCFFFVNEELNIVSYNITINLEPITQLVNRTNENTNPIYINSAISEDKTKSLICYLKEWNYLKCDKYDINNNQLNTIYEERNTGCNNFQFSTTLMYSSINKDEFIFGCYGNNRDYNLIKLDSDFELETIVNNYQYQVNDCDCNTFSIAKFINNEYSVILSCRDKKVNIYNNLPEGIKYAKTQKVVTEENESETTNLVVKTSYIGYTTILENDYTHTEINTDNLVSTQIMDESTQLKGDITNTEIYTYNNFSNQITTESNYLIGDYTFNMEDKTTIINTITQYSDIKEISENIDKTNFIMNEICPEEFLYQNIETKECLNFCSAEELLKKKCKINTVTNSNINNYTESIRNMIKLENLTSETNIIIEGYNTLYQIISSTKMSENENTNMSIIDLGECEKILLETYNLSYLLILKIDTKPNQNSAVILNYEIYNPLNNEQLNLSLCSNVKINTYSRFYPSDESLSKIKQLNEFGYDLYNINDAFYQDICSSFTSENGTDILLSDRKSDFYENTSLCENDCTYKGYNLNTKRVQCECSVKEEIKIEEENKEKSIISSIFSESSFTNIKLLKCYKLVFSKKGQQNNKGSIIFLCIISTLVILSIIYAINQEKYIIRNISKINNEKYKENFNHTENNNNIQPNKNVVFPPKKKNKKGKKKKKNYLIFNYLANNNNNNNMINSTSNIKPLQQNNQNNDKYYFQKYEKKYNNNIKIDEKREAIKYELYNFTNEELNALPYDLAYSYDKRSYFQYYFSLLKQKHLILFTFFNNQDYNIFILKLSLFLSSFALYFAVNALFFTDDTMHNIYKQNGNAGIISQISNIFYSTIISCVINIIIKKLGLSYNDMIAIKKIPNATEGLKQSSLLMKKLKIKFGIFFLIILLLVSFFWYFITAFCAVYKNTQIILIENTLSSFALSLLYPLGINLVPGFFRIPSLKNYTGCNKCLYFFSKLIAFI